MSLAAGPVGRNAEAAGAASLKSVAGIFSYSKTKGLFAGVSLEGSAIIERRDANEKLYGTRFTAQQLLTGSVSPPPQAGPLMDVLNSRVFSGMRAGGDDMYNDIPAYDDRRDDFSSPQRSSTWQDDVYDRPGGGGGFNSPSRSNTGSQAAGPGRPAAPKPNFVGNKTANLGKNEAVAMFNFDADQPGDLGFKKGEIITVLKKTESDNDWWTGMIGTRHGIFPSNYVKMKE